MVAQYSLCDGVYAFPVLTVSRKDKGAWRNTPPYAKNLRAHLMQSQRAMPQQGHPPGRRERVITRQTVTG